MSNKSYSQIRRALTLIYPVVKASGTRIEKGVCIPKGKDKNGKMQFIRMKPKEFKFKIFYTRHLSVEARLAIIAEI